MSKFSGITAENKFGAFKKVLSLLCMTAHAEENEVKEVDEGNTPTPQPHVNLEQIITQTRKEEKDKLYPRIKKLEEDNKKHQTAINNYLIKIGDLTQAVSVLTKENEQLKKGDGEDSEEVKGLKSQIATLTAENEKLKNSSPNEEELRKQIEAEYEIKLYLNEQTAANKDEILSSFLPEVQGKTKEEIDASIQKAKEKSLNIKKELGLIDAEGNPINKPSIEKPKKPKPAPTKPRVANPTEDTGSSITSFDPDYIRNLDPNSEEYREFRKQLGLH